MERSLQGARGERGAIAAPMKTPFYGGYAPFIGAMPLSNNGSDLSTPLDLPGSTYWSTAVAITDLNLSNN